MKKWLVVKTRRRKTAWRVRRKLKKGQKVKGSDRKTLLLLQTAAAKQAKTLGRWHGYGFNRAS